MALYSPVADKSDQCSEGAEDYETLFPLASAWQRSDLCRRNRTRRVITLMLIPVIVLLCVGFGIWLGAVWVANANDTCPSHVQKYSPILSEADTSYHTVRFNGSLLKENAFREGAGPEADAAWESLGVNYRSLSVPANEAAKSGLQFDQVQINPKYGGGFPANVEGLHHLHCLNLLRQSLYYNIDYYRSRGEGAFKNDDNIVRHHVSHCLDIIRQQLMCTPDTGLLGQVWWDPSHPKAFVDFNTEHKCKNFDAIRQWAEDRQIPAQVPMDFLKPPAVGDRIFEAIP